MGEQGNCSYDESSPTAGQWRKGKSKAQVAYVMGAAEADQDTDDISVDSTTAKEYLKRYKKNQKRRKL